MPDEQVKNYYELIREVPLESLLFIDIETVPQKATYEELSETWKQQWKNKMKRNLSEADQESEASVLYQERAGIYPEFGKIIAIGVGAFEKPSKLKVSVWGTCNEKKLLEQFLTIFQKRINKKWTNWNTSNGKLLKDALYIVGHNIREFDIPYLGRRLLVHGLPLPGPLQLLGTKPWENAHLLDLMQLWSFGDKRNFIKLDLLALTLGLTSPKSDMDGSMVAQKYYEGKHDEILNYCAQDVVILAKILLRLAARKTEENFEIESHKEWL